MAKVKTTNRDLKAFLHAGHNWTGRNPAPSKLNYALGRVMQRAQRLSDDMDSDMEDTRVDNCLSDEKTGAILRDERNQYKFTKDGLRAVMKKHRELLDKEVEIEPYFTTELPAADLPDEFRIAFEGFVINPDAPPPTKAPSEATA